MFAREGPALARGTGGEKVWQKGLIWFCRLDLKKAYELGADARVIRLLRVHLPQFRIHYPLPFFCVTRGGDYSTAVIIVVPSVYVSMMCQCKVPAYVVEVSFFANLISWFDTHALPVAAAGLLVSPTG